ncbi:methionine ABC transporter permease [Rothia kristinae]|uniref:ABC transporter permease n=1 Tax=Rothia kristinae TaxID=37923 RepID=A0A147E732_9MICC|nr:methionine ABC transporter permease [Rothia kristinae]MBE8527160.1 ABC transporter permease [Amycolatopsis sp. H6(2020)]MDN5640916.1 ABC transporter permease [Actinomycetes bacterium]TDP54786.1 D-methionine transport system permease protein [Kocuria sp. AG109]KTR38778.1 methionine ABC transporter ATP-binding protein [Rothia kristinae]KTR58480.1 methionine ABC transporter ATP-binding protein [Rothia kristinae]
MHAQFDAALAHAPVLAAKTTDWDTVLPKIGPAVTETLQMVLVTMVLAGIFGLIIGTLLYTTRSGSILANRPVNALLNFLVNLIRPIPFVILLAALSPVMLQTIGTSIGIKAGIFAMVVAATFAISRIVEQNLVSIDPGVIEAARAMGASKLRIMFSVMLPEALGPLILGYTFIVIGVVDMSAMAGAVGGGGIGDFAIRYGYQRFDWNVTLVAIIIIVILVQLVQLVGNLLARKIMRR